jgi:Tfp pilus assembly protein PilN
VAKRINLVPQGERARTTTNVAMLGVVAAAILVLFGLGLGYYLLHNSLGDRQQELQDVETQTNLLEAQVNALSQYERLAAVRAKTEGVVQTIYAGRTLVADLMDALSLVVPENVWFTSLTLGTSDPGSEAANTGSVGRDNRLGLQGNTYSFEDVAQFLVRLQLVPALTGVDLVSAGTASGSTDSTKDVKGFSINAVVSNTQPVDTPLPVSQVEVEGL